MQSLFCPEGHYFGRIGTRTFTVRCAAPSGDGVPVSQLPWVPGLHRGGAYLCSRRKWMNESSTRCRRGLEKASHASCGRQHGPGLPRRRGDQVRGDRAAKSASAPSSAGTSSIAPPVIADRSVCVNESRARKTPPSCEGREGLFEASRLQAVMVVGGFAAGL